MFAKIDCVDSILVLIMRVNFKWATPARQFGQRRSVLNNKVLFVLKGQLVVSKLFPEFQKQIYCLSDWTRTMQLGQIFLIHALRTLDLLNFQVCEQQQRQIIFALIHFWGF